MSSSVVQEYTYESHEERSAHLEYMRTRGWEPGSISEYDPVSIDKSYVPRQIYCRFTKQETVSNVVQIPDKIVESVGVRTRKAISISKEDAILHEVIRSKKLMILAFIITWAHIWLLVGNQYR